jgi:hypothetical protein
MREIQGRADKGGGQNPLATQVSQSYLAGDMLNASANGPKQPRDALLTLRRPHRRLSCAYLLGIDEFQK